MKGLDKILVKFLALSADKRRYYYKVSFVVSHDCKGNSAMGAAEKCRILIVDQDEGTVREVAKHLKEWIPSAERQASKNGADALDKIKKRKYECLITSLRMDEMDGLALLKEVRGMDPQLQPRSILVISDEKDQEQVTRIDSHYKFVAKPIDEQVLKDAMEDTIIEFMEIDDDEFGIDIDELFALKKMFETAADAIDIVDHDRISDVLNLPSEEDFRVKMVDAARKNAKQFFLKYKKMGSLMKMLKKVRFKGGDDEAYMKLRAKVMPYVVCHLAEKMDYKKSETFHALIMASLLHDLTLNKYPQFAPLMNEAAFKQPHLAATEGHLIELFKNHPVEAAEALAQIEGVPEELCIVIREHHELPDGNGFPLGINGQKIHPLSKIFQVALHFVQYVIENPDWGPHKFFRTHQLKLRGPVYRPCLEAIQKLK